MSNENTTASLPSRRGRGFVTALRYLLLLAVLGGIGVGLYFGVPYLYERFIVPVEANTERLAEIEGKQSADVQMLTGQISDLQSRLAGLETGQTQGAQAIAEMTGRVDAVETAVATQTGSLQRLEALGARLDALTATVSGHDTLLAGEGSVLAGLRREIKFSRAIELLARARLHLSQSNFGLAKEDVIAARDLVQALRDEVPAGESSTVQGILTRLDLALGNLPAFPVVAADDVDTAWQLLVNRPVEQVQETLTPVTVTTTPATTVP